MNCPLELRNHYRAGKVIPFVGAGVSMSVQWNTGGSQRRGPSWTELVDEAIRQLGFSRVDLARVRATDLQILEYFRLVNNGLTRLTNWLVLNMDAPPTALLASPIHEELCALAKSRLIYTTNFDDFLERCFELRKRKCKAVAIEDHMADCDADVTEIVKFHGDLNHPQQMLLSESQYERRLSLSTAMDYRLKSDLLGRTVLFIGYSFRDPNVSYLFRLINEQFRALPGSSTGRRAYITVPDPSDFEIRLFRERNIEVIGVDGMTLTEDITKLLQEMRS